MDAQRDQLRTIAKIWTALSKLIRSQCNKNRIIDSLYFGSFGKTLICTDDTNAPNTYSYCPGPRSVFKLLENAENIKQVSQSVSQSLGCLFVQEKLTGAVCLSVY